MNSYLEVVDGIAVGGNCIIRAPLRLRGTMVGLYPSKSARHGNKTNKGE